MQLKKILLVGFKSFADKTVLEFHQGITAIVGPNGCGKSNISDAFRWVLGEQSAKSVRGAKMQDIIFAGTTARKPLNYAEVTLVLTDLEGSLPIDYEEVMVTRRLHRSGESEYFINRHPVRLRDIHDLFLDSGVGKNTFAIFEQGKLDQIIHHSPLERRHVFEEAAGILRFLQRKKEALRKLEQTEQNLVRVLDIHQEVERQIVVLEEQAAKAKVYKENKGELSELEQILYVLKWERTHAIYEQLNKQLFHLSEKKKRVEEGRQKEETQIKQDTEKVSEAEALLKKMEEKQYRVRSEKQMKAHDQLTNKQRLEEIVAKEKQWLDELNLIRSKRKERHIEIQKTSQEQQEKAKQVSSSEADLQEKKECVQNIEASVTESRQKHQTLQQKLFSSKQAESRLEGEIKQATTRMESTSLMHRQLLERKERVSQFLDTTQQEMEKTEEEVKQLKENLERAKKTFSEEEITGQKVQDKQYAAQTDLDQTQRMFNETCARQKVLKRLQEEMEGFSKGSKHLLQESPFKEKLKPLYTHITPSEGFETPFSKLLRPYAETLLVQTCDELKQIIAYAKERKLTDFSLLCLETLSQSETLTQPFAKGSLANHFFKDIHTTKGPITPLHNQNKSVYWTDFGAYSDPRGVLFFPSEGEGNIFLRAAELKALEEKMHSLKDLIKEQTARVEAYRTEKRAVHERLECLNKEIRTQEVQVVERGVSLKKQRNEVERQQAEYAMLIQEIKKNQEEHQGYQTTLTALEEKYQAAQEASRKAESHATLFSSEMETHMDTLKEERNKLHTKEAIFREVTEQHRQLLHKLSILEAQDLESHTLERRLEEEIESTQTATLKIQTDAQSHQNVIQEIDRKLQEVISQCQTMEKNLHEKKQALSSLQESLQEKISELAIFEQKQFQLNMQKEQHLLQMDTLVEELKEYYNVHLPLLRETITRPDKPLEKIEAQVRRLKRMLDQAGDINMTSIEEYDTYKERHTFLNQQLEDINASKDELVKIIAQLDTESRKTFQEVFEKIRTNFRKNYALLFNGGEADLKFTEHEDILDAGVEIIARPPGKKMQSIQLLSGGEKCLTAVALLFAIFEVKPAPFCILDEIDAPLDDTNVERFVKVVQQFIDRCQFIIITHNKRTMAIADRLFGVSMQEKGVSKLLSYEFSKEPELVEIG